METHGDPGIGAGPVNVNAARGYSPRFHRGRQCFKWSRVILAHDSILPPPRSGAASVVVQGMLYMFGGYGGGTGRLDDFYSFDFRTQTWHEVKVVGDERPGCRENNGVVISDSSKSIYLFGGYNGSAWLNDLWRFDIESKRWSCIQESSDPLEGENVGMMRINAGLEIVDRGVNGVRGKKPSRRFGYVSVVHSNKLIIFGGFDGSQWLNDMYVFDFEGRNWTEVHARGILPSVRSCPAWVKDEVEGVLYIQGGYNGVERKDDFFACDLATYTWTQMPTLGSPPGPRYFHSCWLYGNKMYLYGGYSGSQRLRDMHAYDFETSAWSPVDGMIGGEIPSGRSSLVAQVHENYVYVFGGYSGTTVMNDFWKFRLSPLARPPTGLVSDFRRLLNDPEMSDVRFLVEGNEVYAHRAILAVRSEYFRVLLFNGHMRESVQASGSLNMPASTPIKLNDVSYSVFMKVMEYLYTDSVRDVQLGLGIHLLIASEQFMLDRLKLLCEDIIRREVDTSNVISILVTSHQHNAKGLKELAMEFILSNLGEKDIQKGLSDLKTTPELLVEIIQLSSSAIGHGVSPAAPSTGSVGSTIQHQEGHESQRGMVGHSYDSRQGFERGGGGNPFGDDLDDPWRLRR